MNGINKIEYILARLIAIISPWVILLASPQFYIGFWGQVEGMMVVVYLVAAFSSLLLIKVGYKNDIIRNNFSHPLVLLPLCIGFYSILSALFQRLPILALYGSPQIGQGAFWYFSLGVFTALYCLVINNFLWKSILLINFILVILVTTIGSFYPAITGIVISFFGFYDWLALYYASLLIFILYYINIHFSFPYKKILSLLLYISLGPLFWIIDNNSAIALWILILFAWIIHYILSSFNLKLNKYSKYIFNSVFFTAIPIILSILMIVSSFIFWDGKTDQTDIITQPDSILGHLGTLVARGSIVRILFEHLTNIQAIIIGYGWGSVSELLISSFTPEVFYQINTGNRVHFHTHNELFEHIFSIGVVGSILYILYTFYIFRDSFKLSTSVSLIWLLYFCISVFWFQWISNLIIQAMIVSVLIKSDDDNHIFKYFNKVKYFLKSKIFYSLNLLFIFLFLSYGSYIGYFTAIKHMESFRANQLIALAEEYKKGENCSDKISDFGKGGFQFSQKFNGYSNYFKDQAILYGSLNKSDYDVLDWYLCASHELIEKEFASLELINVHINVLSMISVLPGEEGRITREKSEYYLSLWEDKMNLLLYIAPKRVDQATSLISFYLKNNDFNGVERVCENIYKTGFYQGFCDLSIGAILLGKGEKDKGMFLIRRAYENGILDSEDIDEKTSDEIKSLLDDI